jgi:hypothetical protein
LGLTAAIPDNAYSAETCAPFFGDGAPHQQNEKGKREGCRSEEHERVEMGERGGLFLAQVFEGLERDLSGGSGIAR